MARRRRKKNNNSFLNCLVIIIIIIGYMFYQNQDLSLSQLFNSSGNNSSTTKEVSSNLEVYFMDVGQADCILISNNGHNMLIDAGNNEDGAKLVKYFQNELNITSFDYVVGTHPHEDHIGGLDDIINNFAIGTVYMPDVITTTKTFSDVLDALEAKNLSITVPEIGDTFSLGEAEIKVIYTGTDTSDLNNTSIVLKMTFCSHTYLFTGDATKETESKILNQDIQADVLKVGHHGSLYSSSDEFLAQVKPKYAVISVAQENSYGHPGEATINRLKNYTDKIYLTSELGTIKITSDGNSLEFTNFETDTNG